MTNYKPEMTLGEILEIEGIVVRKIPMQSVSRWNHYNNKIDWTKVKKANTSYQAEPHPVHPNAVVVTETRTNALGGKYLVTLQHDQASMVRFNKGRDGIGDTVEEAWRDLVLNGSYYLP